MVGKPNFPDDVDQRDDLKGSASGTPGLTPLDEEREASLADEGGASGAVAESQDLETLKKLSSELPVAHLQPSKPNSPDVNPSKTVIKVATAVAVAGAAVLAYRRWV